MEADAGVAEPGVAVLRVCELDPGTLGVPGGAGEPAGVSPTVMVDGCGVGATEIGAASVGAATFGSANSAVAPASTMETSWAPASVSASVVGRPLWLAPPRPLPRPRPLGAFGGINACDVMFRGLRQPH